jgi:pimeloyl-ACP methyl ester carboxylesterase
MFGRAARGNHVRKMNGAPRLRSAVPVFASLALALLIGSGSASAAPSTPPTWIEGTPFARAAQPTAGASKCGTTKGLVCSEVDVPLDRTGAVAGTIPLHVEVLPNTQGVRRGVIFLVAGGPGQGSARSFDLGSAWSAAFYRFLFPGYTLVAYDDRGTGSSGLLDCSGAQSAVAPDQAGQLVADCAAALGPQRAFYGTADHAEDLEAVRQSLGIDRIAIWGVSYGTKLALAYALAHPDHVERLLLDSVVPPEGSDLFGTGVLQAMPATLAAYCSGGACQAATPDFSGDVVAVANQLAASPLRARVLEANGRTQAVELNALTFLDMVVGADLSPGLAAELPAAVHAARTGDPQPLLRLALLETLGSAAPAADLSLALYLATVCRDGPFPWQPDTPLSDRPALAQAALTALPSGSFGPFGSWANGLSNVDTCLNWPSPTGGDTLGAGPLPEVPVLAISGGLDLRTPTAGAASVVALFPHGQLLVVPGVGHSVLTTDLSGCAENAVRSWMIGQTPPTTCARAKSYLTPVAAFPTHLAKHLDGAQTRALVARTVHEAEAIWLMTGSAGPKPRIPGLDGGELLPSSQSFALLRYSIARGVTLTGLVTLEKIGPPLSFKGFVIVGGTAAAPGFLQLSGGSLRGRLGRKHVGR